MNKALKQAKAKVVAFAIGVKENFKPNEGLSGFLAVKSRFCNLWTSGQNGKFALVSCVVILLMVVKACFSGGQSFTDDQQVGADFLSAYLSGDFLKAVQYADRPGTVNGDAEVMYKIGQRSFETKEEREIVVKQAQKEYSERQQAILALGLDGCDIFLEEDKGSYSGSEHSHYDNNIVYRLVKGKKEQLLELYLQRDRDGKGDWKVMSHPFSFL